MPAVTGATTEPPVNGSQRWRSTVANDGQRWQTIVDHRWNSGLAGSTAGSDLNPGPWGYGINKTDASRSERFNNKGSKG
ncbi:hypothetical protein Tco_0581138, partial [Tanacetum coccineum]